MTEQLSTIGNQTTTTELQQQEEETNLLLTALGGGSLAAGLSVAGDITRRAATGPQGQITVDSLGKAAEEFGLDSKTALSVIFGKSEFDNQNNQRANADQDLRSKARTADSSLNAPASGIAEYAQQNRRGASDFLYVDEPTSGLSTDEIFRSSRVSPKSPERPYVKNPLTQMAVAARDAFIPSSEDFIAATREINRRKGRNPEGPRGEVAVARIPFVDGVRDQLPEQYGGFDNVERSVRKDFGIRTMTENLPQRVGSIVGRSASDFINNGARSLWWLVNAPQAVSDLASESLTGAANRDGLYGSDRFVHDEALKRGLIKEIDADLNEYDIQDKNVRRYMPNILDPDVDQDVLRQYLDAYPEAEKQLQKDLKNLRIAKDSKRPEVEIRRQERKYLNNNYKPFYTKRRTNNNLSTALAFPSAIAINAGMGLVNPNGGSDGYKALYPSQDDPTQTDNVIAEVASKYILGRRGDILPWEEFKKVRPDVSKGEYMAYKGYRYNKKEDYNIFDDGKINVANGIFKANADGLNGPELFFLGKDLPLNTTLTPAAMAMLGAGLGAASARYGYLNPDALAADQRDLQSMKDYVAKKSDVESQMDIARNDGKFVNDKPKAVSDIENMQRNIEYKEPRLKRREQIINQIPDPLLNRLRNRNPVRAGLVGGFGGLVAGNLIGGEIERRRREADAQEIQERGY